MSRLRAYCQKVLCDAYWKIGKHVSNIFTFENDRTDSDTSKPKKIKSFGQISNHLKRSVWDHITQRNGILKTDSKKSQHL